MPERLTRLEGVKTHQPVRPARPGIRGDQANTSHLSQMMSQSVKDLNLLTTPRAEKLQAFKDTLDEPLQASLQVTNIIFDRMLNG